MGFPCFSPRKQGLEGQGRIAAIYGRFLRFGLRDVKSLAICDLERVAPNGVSLWPLDWGVSNGAVSRFGLVRVPWPSNSCFFSICLFRFPIFLVFFFVFSFLFPRILGVLHKEKKPCLFGENPVRMAPGKPFAETTRSCLWGGHLREILCISKSQGNGMGRGQNVPRWGGGRKPFRFFCFTLVLCLFLGLVKASSFGRVYCPRPLWSLLWNHPLKLQSRLNRCHSTNFPWVLSALPT